MFAGANHELERDLYRIEVLSPQGGAVGSNGGVTLHTRAITRAPVSVDTLLIAGAEEAALRAVIADETVRRWVPRLAARARRVGSVCSGTFVLASLGLIDGPAGSDALGSMHTAGCDVS